MDSSQPPVITSPNSRRMALFLKIGGVCLLVALLHVPLALTDGVLRERRGYQSQAVGEIAAVWGGRQVVTGPVLAVPYSYRGQVSRTKMINGNAVQIDEAALLGGTAYFLPDELAVRGRVEPESRYRGIHEAIVYSAQLALEGRFNPDFAAAGITAETVHWEQARVLFGVGDPKGIRSVSPIAINDGAPAAFQSAGAAGSEGLSLAAAVVGAGAAKGLAFKFDAVLQGSERLEVCPVGKSTNVVFTAAWPDPSFAGAALPTRRTVSAEGFEAEWQASHFSRAFGQSWTNRQSGLKEMSRTIADSALGVVFARPVDGYRQAERAQKYGVLFFVLVFTVFFLFEITASMRIHPLQYAMVGAALCLFFLGFLALSEFLPTGVAYGLAAAACTALISLYSRSVLKSGPRTLVVTGGLAATYGYLYFVLKSQDYALVAGTAALFVALAIVMFCTRRINWYSLEMNAAAPGAR